MKILGLALAILMAGCSSLFPADSDGAETTEPSVPASSSKPSDETDEAGTSASDPPTGQLARQLGAKMFFEAPNWTYTWELREVDEEGSHLQLTWRGIMEPTKGGIEVEDWVINGTTMNVDRQTRWGGGTLRSTCTGDGAGILPLTGREYGCRMDVVRERFDVDFRLIPGSVKTVEVEGHSFVTQNYTLMGTLDGTESVYDAGDYSEELGFWTRMEFALHNGVKFDLVKIEMPDASS